MTPAAAPTLSLANPDFRRLLRWSAGLHGLLSLILVVQPRFFSSRPPLQVSVEVIAVAALEAAAPPSPPQRQVIDEPIVIPKRPTPKPKPKPEPVAKAKPEPKPEKPTEPALTPEQILAQLRAETPDPTASRPSPGLGRLDPENARYLNQLKNLIYARWVIEPRFRLRSGLVAEFEFRIGAGGSVSALRLTKSSGDRSLDESAERAIYKAAPFPPPPSGVGNLKVQMNPRERS